MLRSGPERTRRARRATERARAAAVRQSSAQNLEVTVRDFRKRGNADRGATRVVLGTQPFEDVGKLFGVVERDPAVSDELRMPAASQMRRGQPTGKSLEQCVGARIVAARREEHVVGPQDLRQ